MNLNSILYKLSFRRRQRMENEFFLESIEKLTEIAKHQNLELNMQKAMIRAIYALKDIPPNMNRCMYCGIDYAMESKELHICANYTRN